MQGKIISNISNLYYIEANEKIYTCNARGKLKDEGIVVGDIVDFDENENIIEKIEERDNYIKRPKISNITQIVCVLSAKNPKPDLLYHMYLLIQYYVSKEISSQSSSFAINHSSPFLRSTTTSGFKSAISVSGLILFSVTAQS